MGLQQTFTFQERDSKKAQIKKGQAKVRAGGGERVKCERECQEKKKERKTRLKKVLPERV